VSIDINGSAFLSSLRDLEAGLRNNAAQTMRATVKTAEAVAKGTKLFNDITGALRKSISSEATGLEGKVIAASKYARFVEYGTSGTYARPFMAEAARVGQQTLDYGLEISTDQAIAVFNRSG